MAAQAPLWVKTTISVAGAAVAGPAGAILGRLVGSLLDSAIPGIGEFLGAVTSNLASDAVVSAGGKIVKRITLPEKQRINHDLQDAFRDACCEALVDIGGKECFAEAWATRPRDVPRTLLFPETNAGHRIWRDDSPLAVQIADCLRGMVKAIQEQRLIPIEPLADVPAASVEAYLQVETPEGMNQAFYEQVLAPYLLKYQSLLTELPELNQHLRRYLLDRALVHLGELLKTRTPAWRAFNRAVLDELREQVNDLSGGQVEILHRLDALAQPLDNGQVADTLAGLLAAYGAMEKDLTRGLDELGQQAAEYHRQTLDRLEILAASSTRLETDMKRALRILEDKHRVSDGPALAVSGEEPAPGDSPFKGMQYYEEDDAPLFFGRELLVARLVGLLSERPMLLITGASGSGKSSLVRAGLLPTLRNGNLLANGNFPPTGAERWPAFLFTPTAHPLEALASCLTRESESVRASSVLVEDLLTDPRSLDLYARRLLDPADSSQKLLLVVDQFEEVFTLCHDSSERQCFIDALLATASKGQGSLLRVVITLRADFYANCAQYPELLKALNQWQELIGPMEPSEVRRVIEEPARLGGWTFEPGLVELILHDIGAEGTHSHEPGALPLLSHALLETWKHRRGRMMTLESYAESGGVHKAIARTAESVYTRKLDDAQRTVARRIFLRLTELGEGTPDTRRRAQLVEFTTGTVDEQILSSVLAVLTEARLITVAEGTAEVAHEALIREWPTLQRWLEEDRESIRVQRRLIEAADEWQRAGQDAGLLYRGARLAETIEWAATHEGELSAFETSFLRASQALHESELDQARKRAEDQARVAANMRRRALYLAGALAVVAVLAVLSVLFWRRADQQSRISQSGKLAALSQLIKTEFPERSVLLALESFRISSETGEKHIPEAEQALRDALLHISGIGISGQETDIYDMTFSPDNRWLATGSIDGSIHLYDTTQIDSLNHPLVLKGHLDGVTALAFSPDSHLLATGGGSELADIFIESGTLDSASSTTSVLQRRGDILGENPRDYRIRVWDVSNPDPQQFPVTLFGHEDQISSLAFSPDGLWLASGSYDNNIYLWKRGPDDKFSSTPVVLKGHTENIISIAFDPKGRWLVSASLDRTARLWDMTADDPTTASIVLSGYSSRLQAMAISPDGQWLATSCLDSTVWVWDIKDPTSGMQPIILSGHTKNIMGLAFSPDNLRLASGSLDGTIRLWNLPDISSKSNSQVLQGPENVNFSALTFTSDNRWLVAGGSTLEEQKKNSAIYVWDMSKNITTVLPKVMPAHDYHISKIALSPDGKWFASASTNGSARLWATNSFDYSAPGSPVTNSPFVLPPLQGAYVAMAVSPDGHWLAAAAGNTIADSPSQIILKPLETIKNAGYSELEGSSFLLTGHEGPVTEITFSPDNRWLASASEDGYVRIWDVKSPKLSDPIYKVIEHPGKPQAVIFSPDNHWLATAADGKEIFLWDIMDDSPSKAKIVLSGLEDDVNSSTIQFSPDGLWLAAGTYFGEVYVWKITPIDQIQPLLKLVGHTDEITMLRFAGARSDQLITASADTTARIWRLDYQKATSTSKVLRGHLNHILAMAISPDNHWLATGSSDNTARLWDLTLPDPGIRSLILGGHTNWVFNVAFSQDSHWLITSSLDGSSRKWDLSVSNPITTAVEMPGNTPVFGMAISPADDWLITISRGGEVANNFGNLTNIVGIIKLWQLDIDNLKALACQTVGRNLSFTEWQEYFPDEEYRLTCLNNPINPSILTEVHRLAYHGEEVAANKLLARMKELDPNFNANPDIDIVLFRAEGLIKEGQILAQSLDVPGAVTKFNEAIKLVPSLATSFTPEIEAKRIASAASMNQVYIYIDQGNYKNAQSYLINAQTLDPELEGTSELWNIICRQGSLDGFVSDVYSACENALSIDPFNADFHDSRGLARALTGDIKGAIEDFEYYSEWVSGRGAMLRKEWVVALGAGQNPFDEKTLLELKNHTITLPDNQVITQTIPLGEKLTLEIDNIPDGLSLEFPAFLQCRADGDSEQLVEDYWGIVAMNVTRDNAWVDAGNANFILESSDGQELGRYPSGFEFASNETGWLMSNQNGNGLVMQSSDTSVAKLRIEFNDVYWRPVSQDNLDYKIETEARKHSLYNSEKYPQHQLSLNIKNIGAMKIQKLSIFGIVMNHDGQLIDMLFLNPTKETLSPDEASNFEIRSMSKSGRCVGPADPQGYTIHYWVTFTAEDGERITDYNYVTLP